MTTYDKDQYFFCNKIVRHVRKVYTMRFANGILDSVLVKYCATMTAY